MHISHLPLIPTPLPPPLPPQTWNWFLWTLVLYFWCRKLVFVRLSGFEALWGRHCVGPASHPCSPTSRTPSSPRGLHSILPIGSGHLNCVANTRGFLCICVYNLAGQSCGCGILKCATELPGSHPFQAAESAPGKDGAFWSCELVAWVELVWEAQNGRLPGGLSFLQWQVFT